VVVVTDPSLFVSFCSDWTVVELLELEELLLEAPLDELPEAPEDSAEMAALAGDVDVDAPWVTGVCGVK